MSAVYIDSGPFIGYLRRKDKDHQVVREHFLEFEEMPARLVTCDAVIGEVATRLRYDSGFDAVLKFRRFLKALGRRLQVLESSPDRREHAFDLIAHYDNLRLSYPDAVGAVVAREVRASTVFTLDDDFRVMGFAVVP